VDAGPGASALLASLNAAPSKLTALVPKIAYARYSQMSRSAADLMLPKFRSKFVATGCNIPRAAKKGMLSLMASSILNPARSNDEQMASRLAP
jgi:hypothetical protein